MEGSVSGNIFVMREKPTKDDWVDMYVKLIRHSVEISGLKVIFPKSYTEDRIIKIMEEI